MGWYHVNNTGKGINLGDGEEVHYNEDFLARYVPTKEEVLALVPSFKNEDLEGYEAWPLGMKFVAAAGDWYNLHRAKDYGSDCLKEEAHIIYAETRDKNYQAETGCAYAKFNSCKIAEPDTKWEELTPSQMMQAMSMSLFQMLGNGDDRGEPILIKTANTTKEVWCPFYADKVAIKAANVFERIYAEVKAAYEENSAFAKFDTLNHEEKMCEISSYVMHNFENILKEIEAIPGIQTGKY